ISSFDAVTATVRLGNRTQISRKAIVVADTVEAVSKAGRKAELAYQITKRSAEIKRDMEKNALDNVGAVAGGTATAPKTGSMGATDIYVGEFGTYSIVPNRFQRDRDAWILDFEYVSIVYLRPFGIKELAATGDAEKRMLRVEWGLKVFTDFAHGLVADLV